MTPLAAFLLAAQPGPGADMALIALYDSACVRRLAPGADFRSVGPEAMPNDLTHQYIGPQAGLYWRRELPTPAFVAWTRGPGHWGGTEEFCTVAIQGAHFPAIVAAFSSRTGDRTAYGPFGSLAAWERGAENRAILVHQRDRSAVGVQQRPDNWVAVGIGGFVTETARR